MKSTKTGSIIAILLAAVGVLILTCWRSFAVEAVYPVERMRQAFARSVWPRVSGLFDGGAARAENVRLQREVAALSVLRGDVERLTAENARLRRALGYAERMPEAWLAAGVLSSGGGAAGAYHSVRVDKGSLAGVRPGDVVVVPEGLVGQVADVTPHTADVLLITDPSLKVACEMEAGTSRRSFGILSGGDEEALRIRHLGNAGSLTPHSRVFTSGRGGVFPRGLAVGTLQEVRRDSMGLVREGEVQPSVDFSTLEDVFIRREK